LLTTLQAGRHWNRKKTVPVGGVLFAYSMLSFFYCPLLANNYADSDYSPLLPDCYFGVRQ
jgi:hypothetical protein